MICLPLELWPLRRMSPYRWLVVGCLKEQFPLQNTVVLILSLTVALGGCLTVSLLL